MDCRGPVAPRLNHSGPDGRLVSNGALADRFREAYTIAQQVVDSGKAAALLDEWIAVALSHSG